jgi:hypothetical protein
LAEEDFGVIFQISVDPEKTAEAPEEEEK